MRIPYTLLGRVGRHPPPSTWDIFGILTCNKGPHAQILPVKRRSQSTVAQTSLQAHHAPFSHLHLHWD